jgi:hypothetical protein
VSGPEDSTQTVIYSRAQMAAMMDPRLHTLVAVSGSPNPFRRVIPTEPLVLGRSRECDLHLVDRQVSSRHCRVQLRQDRVWVEDLNSSNGTWIDGERVQGRQEWPVGSTLQLGLHVFRHEFRTPQETQREDDLQADLQRAGAYLRSLLPPPLAQGPLRAEWVYRPAALLCGDAFGWHALDDHRTAIYLMDVSGHGAGAAIHTATALNALRQGLLPGVDFGDPAAVLDGLNRAYPMERHGNMYFSIWYGVHDRAAHRLQFASAGHPPALLKGPGGELVRLHTQRVAIGLIPDETYETWEAPAPPGSTLYVFSDGVYDVETPQGLWSLEEFIHQVSSPRREGHSEATRLHQHVQEITGDQDLRDDFTLLVLDFEPNAP